MKTTFILFLCISSTIYGQWRYKTEKDPFDGDYKMAYVIGKGRFPYNTPALAINKFGDSDFNFYVTNFGYAGCDGNGLDFSFGDGEVYSTKNINSNADRDALFINEIHGISMYGFIKLLMEKSKLYIRHSNSCGSSDMVFSLSGSSANIKRVIGDWLEEQEQIFTASEEEINTIAEYYIKLGCNDLLDTIKPMYTEYIDKTTNVFKTMRGATGVLKGTVVKYYNSNHTQYNILVSATKDGDEERFYVDGETAEYITQSPRAIREIRNGLAGFWKRMENCK